MKDLRWEISHGAASSARYEWVSHYGATIGARGQSARSEEPNYAKWNKEDKRNYEKREDEWRKEEKREKIKEINVQKGKIWFQAKKNMN